MYLYRKKTISMAIVIVFFAAVVSTAAQYIPIKQRVTLNINQNWKFFRGTPVGTPSTLAYKDASWETIHLPHSLKYTTIANPEVTRDFGWYRKSFTLDVDKTKKRVFVEFQGVMQTTSVWVNGIKIGDFAMSGYNSFHFDITEALNAPGVPNILVVLCNNKESSIIPPDGQKMDFYLFGGIYRDVFITIRDNIYITHPWEDTQAGVFVTTPDLSATSGKVQVRTTVKNSSVVTKTVKVVNTIVDASNEVIAILTASQSVASGASYTFTQLSDPISNPKLWTPNNPYLYTVHTVIHDGEVAVENQDTRFGMRWYTFNATNGFFLNGQSVKLMGINIHQAYPFVGNAVPNKIFKMQLEEIKSLGMNFVRLAHYPYDPDFLDYCDELGLMVMQEGPTWWTSGGTTWEENVAKSIRSMIRRDRNHPSVILWSGIINHVNDCVTAFTDAIKQEDPTRRIGGNCDVKIPHCFTNGEVTSGGICSEHTGHTFPTSRWDNEAKLRAHSLRHHTMMNASYGQPANAGIAGWVMYDYNTSHNEPGTNFVYHGLSDIMRIPKFAYYAYKAELTTAPMVFIASQWTSSSQIPIEVYSNCDSVELMVNGKNIGKSGPSKSASYSKLKRPPFFFSGFSFVAGELTANGYINGNLVATHSVKTPGQPVAVKLTPDFTNLPANGSDFVRVVASIVDANGTVVPNATNTVNFSISNPSSGKIISQTSMSSYGGMSIVLIQSTLVPGDITVTASSSNLNNGTTLLKNSETVPLDENVRRVKRNTLNSTSLSKGQILEVYTLTGQKILTLKGEARTIENFKYDPRITGKLVKGLYLYKLHSTESNSPMQPQSGKINILF